MNEHKNKPPVSEHKKGGRKPAAADPKPEKVTPDQDAAKTVPDDEGHDPASNTGPKATKPAGDSVDLDDEDEDGD